MINHSKSKCLKTAVVYYFLMILWVDWKVLLLGLGGLTHMSVFSWAQMGQHCSAVHGVGWAHSTCSQLAVQQGLFSSGRPHLVASLGFLTCSLQRIKVESAKCLEAY